MDFRPIGPLFSTPGTDGTAGLCNYGSWTKYTTQSYGINIADLNSSRVQAATRSDYFGRQIAQADNGPNGQPAVYAESTFDRAGTTRRVAGSMRSTTSSRKTSASACKRRRVTMTPPAA